MNNQRGVALSGLLAWGAVIAATTMLVCLILHVGGLRGAAVLARWPRLLGYQERLNRLLARWGAGVVVGLGIWWRKQGANGTNVNELTHQQLTDIGRAPCFYD